MTPEHELDSEDDEAPEEVTFQTARVSAEESARLKREVARRDKVLLKEKRIRKIELFKDQKKKKLLSEDILHTVSSLPDDQKQPSECYNEENTGDGEQLQHVKTKRAKKLHPKKRLAKKYNVLRLKDCGAIDLQQKKAENFIKKRLYGVGKNRTTANALLSVSSKKGLIKKAAAQFTDNTWGAKDKQNATLFKLSWTRRQKF